MIKELLVCMLLFSNNYVISKKTDVDWDTFKKSCKENGGLIILASICVVDKNYETESPPAILMEKTEIDIEMSNVQIVKIAKHVVTFRSV